MKVSLGLLLIPISVSSLSVCKEIDVIGLGEPDGQYISIAEYRGRPDFYSLGGGVYNLFGEENEDNICIWRIDNNESLFPYYETNSCAFHPSDIYVDSVWYLYNDKVEPVQVYPTFECTPVKKSNTVGIIIIVSVILSILLIALIVLMHVVLRRRRIKRWKEKCPVCVKRVERASSVITQSFRN